MRSPIGQDAAPCRPFVQHVFFCFWFADFSGLQHCWYFSDRTNYDGVTVMIHSKHRVCAILIDKGLNVNRKTKW